MVKGGRGSGVDAWLKGGHEWLGGGAWMVKGRGGAWMVKGVGGGVDG